MVGIGYSVKVFRIFTCHAFMNCRDLDTTAELRPCLFKRLLRFLALLSLRLRLFSVVVLAKLIPFIRVLGTLIAFIRVLVVVFPTASLKSRTGSGWDTALRMSINCHYYFVLYCFWRPCVDQAHVCCFWRFCGSLLAIESKGFIVFG